MRKVLRVFSICLLVASLFTISVYADNRDTSFYMYFDKNNDRTGYTEFRMKENATPVYVTATNNSLPYNGFYITIQRKEYNSRGNPLILHSSDSLRINDYREYLVRLSADHVPKLQHRIRGTYPDTTYTWGSVTGLWSPDSVYYSGLVYLN